MTAGWLRSSCAIALLSSALGIGPLRGQIAQATASLRTAHPSEVELILKAAEDDVQVFSRSVKDFSAPAEVEYASLAMDVVLASSQVVVAASNARSFTTSVAAWQAARAEYHRRCAAAKCGPVGATQLVGGELPPQVRDIVPSVVFGVGIGSTFGSGLRPVYPFELSTNILGSAAGSLLGAVGSDDLKDYFTKNLSVGTAIPLGSGNRLSGTVGVGMGQLSFKHLTVWPVLTVEQVDSADQRVPRALVARKPLVGNWTFPSISVGAYLGSASGFKQRVEQGRPAPILVLGLSLPYYFDGDPFGALAALITTKRENYEREGSVRVSLGLALPLVRAQAK